MHAHKRKFLHIRDTQSLNRSATNNLEIKSKFSHLLVLGVANWQSFRVGASGETTTTTALLESVQQDELTLRHADFGGLG